MTTDTKVKDVIVLKKGEAALVLKADDTMDIIVPDGEHLLVLELVIGSPFVFVRALLIT